jgi:DNA-binding NtrC family response regulator
VLVLDADRVGRAALVRSLLRAGCTVVAAGTLDEVDEALGGSDRFDIVLVSTEKESVVPLIATVVALEPDLPVIAIAGGDAQAAAVMEEGGVSRFQVCSRDAWATELVPLLQQALR